MVSPNNLGKGVHWVFVLEDSRARLSVDVEAELRAFPDHRHRCGPLRVLWSFGATVRLTLLSQTAASSASCSAGLTATTSFHGLSALVFVSFLAVNMMAIWYGTTNVDRFWIFAIAVTPVVVSLSSGPCV